MIREGHGGLGPLAPEPLEPSEAPAPLARWRGWLAGLAGCTAVSVLVAAQNYAQLAGRAPGVTFTGLLLRELPVWYVWLLFSPGIFALARRIAAGGRRPSQVALLQLPAGLAVTTLYLAAVHLSRVLLFPGDLRGAPGFGAVFGRMLTAYLFLFFIVYLAIVAAYHALAYYREYQRRALRASQLEALLAQAQLDTLRMQLHPHFLFNALHSISALMARDVPAARRMIARLSDLLRLSLDDDGAQEVPLHEELDFLRRYVELQQLRFGSRLVVTYAVAPGAERVLVPRLVLQPLVENAIRHGIAVRARGGEVEVRARIEGDRLCVAVADDGVGLPAAGADAVREGVGLRNTRARLAQLYGDAHRFAIEGRAGGGALVTLAIPARRAADPPAPPDPSLRAGQAAPHARRDGSLLTEGRP